MNGEMKDTSASYKNVKIIQPGDIEGLVGVCSATGVNLMIYGEAGSGKSQIIQGLANENREIVTLGAASLSEEALIGIPYISEQNGLKQIKYSVPEWLTRVEAAKNKSVILFIDEFNLATSEVKNNLQILLTDRALPNHPAKKLGANVVIVAATNSVSESYGASANFYGSELTAPMLTRFISVRLVNSVDNYFGGYIASLRERGEFKNIESVLGERAAKFFECVREDFRQFWHKNNGVSGVCPRSVMNFFKMCEYAAGNGDLSLATAKFYADVATGVTLSHTGWCEFATPTSDPEPEKAKERDIMEIIMDCTSEIDLDAIQRSITQGRNAGTKKSVRALIAIKMRRAELEEQRKKEAKEA